MLANNHWSNWHTSHPLNSTHVHLCLAICTPAAVQRILVRSFSLPSILPPYDVTWSRALNTGNAVSFRTSEWLNFILWSSRLLNYEMCWWVSTFWRNTLSPFTREEWLWRQPGTSVNQPNTTQCHHVTSLWAYTHYILLHTCKLNNPIIFNVTN